MKKIVLLLLVCLILLVSCDLFGGSSGSGNHKEHSYVLQSDGTLKCSCGKRIKDSYYGELGGSKALEGSFIINIVLLKDALNNGELTITKAADIVLFTNGESIKINAPNAVLVHYGTADDVEIKAVKSYIRKPSGNPDKCTHNWEILDDYFGMSYKSLSSVRHGRGVFPYLNYGCTKCGLKSVVDNIVGESDYSSVTDSIVYKNGLPVSGTIEGAKVTFEYDSHEQIKKVTQSFVNSCLIENYENGIEISNYQSKEYGEQFCIFDSTGVYESVTISTPSDGSVDKTTFKNNYEYDKNGRISKNTQIRTFSNGGSETETDNFEYDNLNRVTKYVRESSYGKRIYEYEYNELGLITDWKKTDTVTQGTDIFTNEGKSAINYSYDMYGLPIKVDYCIEMTVPVVFTITRKLI